MTHLLASIQAQPYFLQHGWRLSPTQLRTLARYIGQPSPRLRRIQEHTVLSAHIALAASGGWLTVKQHRLELTPKVYEWLRERPVTQIDRLLAALKHPITWPEAVERFRLKSALGPETVLYVQQQLARARRQRWRSRTKRALSIVQAVDRWRLQTHADINLESLFHLHQLATYLGAEAWELTPVSLSRAVDVGYGLAEIVHWLEKAQQSALTAEQKQTLADWIRQRQRITLAQVYLLTTSQPEYLDAMMSRRTLRRHIQRRISSRHALVTAAIEVSLQQYWEQRGVPFSPAQVAQMSSDMTDAQPDLNLLIGLHVLIGLRRYLPLDRLGLKSTLMDWSAQYTAQQQNEAAEQARIILNDVQRVIQGRDAFWPAWQPIDAAVRAQIQETIACDGTLTIDYQGLGEAEPRRRTIEPHWLEQVGNLEYVHAYCRLVEGERAFRLDRVLAILP